nr:MULTISPECIES: hypothetical protein [Pseudomonas]
MSDAGEYQFQIRFEGGDAVFHRMDMAALAESLDGFSRIYSVATHFAVTGQYAKQLQALSTKTYVCEPEAKCVSLAGAVAWMSTNGVFQGLGAAVLTLVITYIYQRNSGNKEEMKHLRELFEKQLGFNHQYVEKLISTIDKLAEALQPSVRKSVAPIGKTCERIDLYDASMMHSSIGQAEKDLILSDEPSQILPERDYSVIISEMDKLKRTCKISFAEQDTEESTEEDGSPRRISCEITDPVAVFDDNPYMNTFMNGKVIVVRAKALLRNGIISKLYISDSQ